MEIQHRSLNIPVLFHDKEFAQPPYNIHSDTVKNLDEDKYTKCLMSNMSYHAEGFAEAYNAMVP